MSNLITVIRKTKLHLYLDLSSKASNYSSPMGYQKPIAVHTIHGSLYIHALNTVNDATDTGKLQKATFFIVAK